MNLASQLKNLALSDLRKLFPSIGQKLDIRRHFESIKPQLTDIEERINFQAREFDPGIVGYVEYACESKGKRIRPSLVLLTAHATGRCTDSHLDLGVVVELIHLATLVHDDIMDEADTRRGKPTAWAKWGAELSVLLGDTLFCKALLLCTRFRTTDISKKIAEAANEVCSGEILQTQRRFDLKLSVPEYLRIIEMKTAALFRVSTELAAFLNDCPEDQVRACREYGTYLGVAYQIYDDCLDLVGTEGSTGKTVGTDLEKGKLTLPLLHMLQQASPEEHELICETILHGSSEERIKLLAVVLERGGLKQSVRKIQYYLDQADAVLDILPDNEYREALRGIPRAVRDHVASLMD